jgi:hypothetical protein
MWLSWTMSVTERRGSYRNTIVTLTRLPIVFCFAALVCLVVFLVGAPLRNPWCRIGLA